MNTGTIIFSRFDSRRLPGKALREINGICLLKRVLDKSKMIGLPIVLATTTRGIDQPIVDFAKFENVKIYRGSCNNLVKRAMVCAEENNFDNFFRVCGDRPFFDASLSKNFLREMRSNKFDLVTNSIGNTYPPGMTMEAVSTKTLKRILRLTDDRHHLEHMTSYLYKNQDMFKIVSLVATSEWPKISLAVDTLEDLLRADYIAKIVDDQSNDVYAKALKNATARWLARGT